MGLVFERGTTLAEAPRTHGVASWLVPLDASVVGVRIDDAVVRVDKSTLLLVPARAAYGVIARTAVVELVTLHFHPAVLDRAAAEYVGQIDRGRLDELVAHTARLPRTNWINELCHRYLFERHECSRHASEAARFLETELAKELYYVARERADRQPRASLLAGVSDVTARALAVIEAHLFDPLDSQALARTCGASPSTLLRAFRRDLDVAPSVYVRQRRLDEAMLLLKAGRYAVTDVASMVGYQTVAAFSHAFHKRFGETPSAVRLRAE